MDGVGDQTTQNDCDPHRKGMVTQEQAPGDEDDDVKCYLPHRYVLFILMFMMTTVVFAMRSSFTLALVAMVNATDQFNESDACPVEDADNSSAPITDGEFDWSTSLQSIIMSSFYYTYIIMQFPGGYLAERYGAKWVIFSAVFVPGVLYVLVPTMARVSAYALIALQALSGLFSGPLFPAVHTMWARWAPERERTILIGNSVNGVVLGEIIALGLTGYLSDSSFLGGWPSVFYLFGGLEIIFCIFWVIFAQSTPGTDPRISTKEREYIESQTSNIDRTKYRTPPYRSILTSPPVWATLTAAVTDAFWFYVMFATMPFYMQRILHFSNTQIGIISTVPVASAFLGCSLFPIIADILRAKRILSTTTTRKMATGIGTLLMASLFVLIPVAGCNKVMVLSIVIITSFINGANMAGYVVNGTDIAPQFAGTLSGLFNTAANMCGFISPLVVQALSGLSTGLAGWADVFYVTTAIIVVGGLVFIIFGSGDVQEWARPEVEDEIVEDEGISGRVNDAYTGEMIPMTEEKPYSYDSNREVPSKSASITDQWEFTERL